MGKNKFEKNPIYPAVIQYIIISVVVRVNNIIYHVLVMPYSNL